ncbi:hypothetical protein S40293_07995 [Stachybotrys chartarum IBT 40293]|nr:hypothetical protein S40293_07995 [Stachybotrys chartarum IBT 40293]KFA71206.1 hypothetical protein S40288_03834 [Stachybotrys chartarum IBT 40288]
MAWPALFNEPLLREVSSHSKTLATTLSLTLLVSLLIARRNQNDPSKPPLIYETIPYVSNIWQYVVGKRLFFRRVSKVLETTPLVQCRMGPISIYFVSGGSYLSALFKSSFITQPSIIRVIDYSAGYEASDVAKFAADDSGSAHVPLRGSNVGSDDRIWHAMHRLHSETLLSSAAANAFAAAFQDYFSQELATSGRWIGRPGEWATTEISSFLRKHMMAAATKSIVGPSIYDMSPDFDDAFWKYEPQVETLAFGLPDWMTKAGLKARDEMRAIWRRWYEATDAKYDWSNSHDDVDLDPVFGSRISKGLARMGKSFGFSNETMGASYAIFLVGVHTNTIATCTWIVMELIKDPSLWRAVKEEVLEAQYFDHTGLKLNVEKLVSQPLLQSVYAEILRLYSRFLIARTATESVTVCGYTLPKGSTVMTPVEASHLREDIWGAPSHPASEFWAARHIVEIEAQDEHGSTTKRKEYSLGDRKKFFLPYGGGLSMCPGRNIGKVEVILCVSMLVQAFEVDFSSVEWVKEDGSPSERPASDEDLYSNAMTIHPDREMRVRWRKL